MNRRMISICWGFAWLAGIAAAQPMTPDEAQAACKNAVLSPELLPGSYRQVSEHESSRGIYRTTVCTLRKADGQVWVRRETVRVSPEGIPERKPMVTIITPEGSWQLLSSVAVLTPNLPPWEKTRAPAGAPTKNDFMARTAEAETHRVWSGERFKEGDKRLIRVTAVRTEKGIQLMRELAKDVFDEEKEKMKMPWAARVIMPAMLGPVMATYLPVRTEYVIDADTNLLLTTRDYSRNGRLFHEDRSDAPRLRLPGYGPVERVPDWPPETFELPPQLERIRAKTPAEGLELFRQYAQAEREARAKAAAPPASPAAPAAPAGEKTP